MKKNKILIAGIAALAALATVGGTWAAWTQTLLAKNEFMTAKYSTFLREEFDPPSNWAPGIEEEKVVWAENSSTIPIIAKITMSQKWERREDVKAWTASPGEIPKEEVVAHEGEILPLVFEREEGVASTEEYAAILNFNTDSDPERSSVVVLKNSRAYAEGLKLGLPVVDTLEAAKGKWLLDVEEPVELGKYTFYFMDQVPVNGKTPALLKSVTMNPLLENTVIHKDTYYVGDTQYTIDTVNGKYGYDACRYTLDINLHTVQATKDAVNEVYQPQNPITQYISGYIAGDGVYESTSKNTLAFDQNNGKMVYYPIDQISADGKEGGNWFMSFTNMVPGGTYIDRLAIENRSSKKYELFMQVKPRTQDGLKDELLKKISMEVYYGDDDKPLYQGDATGYHYTDANGTDLQNLVNLGVYNAGQKGQIRVVLKLDPQIGLQDDGSYKYADLLTKIDWEFYVTETSDNPGGGGSGGGGGGGGGGRGRRGNGDGSLVEIEDEMIPLAVLPATGDNMPVVPVAVTALVSMLLMLLFAKLGKEKKKA